jgi:hypothetical protein
MVGFEAADGEEGQEEEYRLQQEREEESEHRDEEQGCGWRDLLGMWMDES